MHVSSPQVRGGEGGGFVPSTIKRSTRLVRPPPVSARAGATRHAAELCAISVVRASDILCHHATSARPQ